MGDPLFKKGDEIEISSNEPGFRGSWYTGTIVQSTSKNDKTTVVEYKALMEDDNGLTKPLRESVDVLLLRPIPPQCNLDNSFQINEKVNAFYNDGWWEGVVTKILSNGKYSVYFRTSKEQIDFVHAKLRLHREWVSGEWVPPVEEKNVQKNATNPMWSKQIVVKKDYFSEGALVEVSTDEEGFQGCWFPATIIKGLSNEKFVVEYETLTTEDGNGFLQEEAEKIHVRPRPLESYTVDSYILLEEVDAMYNDGWWVGVISKVHKGSTYTVTFNGTIDVMTVEHANLRPHQEWINGKWFMCSKVLKSSNPL